MILRRFDMGENAGFDKEREVVASLNKKLFAEALL